jgi:ribonuclease HI
MKSTALPEIYIYTDGAAVPNPGHGGWAAILRGKKTTGEPIEKEISGMEPSTTSIRMELRAAIEALNALKQPCKVWIFSDSRYLCNGAKVWLPLWKSRNWHSKSGEEIKNLDLWKQLDLLMQSHQVTWEWIKGHADNEFNQRVDQLARAMILHPELPLLTQDGYHLFVSVTSVAGAGGWGGVIRKGTEKFDYGGCRKGATVNQLEMQALIEGIERVPEGEKIYLYTKNNYIYSAISHDIVAWKEKHWVTASGKPVKNRELWEKLLDVQQKRKVSWYLVADKKLSEFSMAQAVAKKQLNK